MPDNYPGPHVVDISYNVSNLTHHMQLNCDAGATLTPGADLATINLTQRNGSPVNVITAVTAWVNLIKALFNTAVTFNDFVLWQYTVGTFDRIFINSAVLDIAGTSATATVLAGQSITTFRTVEGGVMKLNLMESISPPAASVARAALTGTYDTMCDFVEGLTNWILARDTSYPIAGIATHPGQSEAVFKTRYRSL